MSGLAEFLLARIAEREQSVREVAEWRGNWHRVAHADACDWWGDAPGSCTCGSVDRVLAECEAKRRIVEWHQNWPVLVEGPPEMEPAGTDVHQMTLRMSKRIAWLTEQEYRSRFGAEPPSAPILLMLAQPYADHPDFRDEWRI